MGIFCKKPEPHGTCSQCGVHFKPRKDRYADLCLSHAQSGLDRDTREATVLLYVKLYWEEFETQALEIKKRHDEANRTAMQNVAATAEQQDAYSRGMQSAAGGSPFGGLGSLGGLVR